MHAYDFVPSFTVSETVERRLLMARLRGARHRPSDQRPRLDSERVRDRDDYPNRRLPQATLQETRYVRSISASSARCSCEIPTCLRASLRTTPNTSATRRCSNALMMLPRKRHHGQRSRWRGQARRRALRARQSREFFGNDRVVDQRISSRRTQRRSSAERRAASSAHSTAQA
jgi:hypothetical protein